MLILDGPLERKPAAYRDSLLASVDAALTYSREPSEKYASPLRLLRSATPRPETPARLAVAWHPATARLEPAEDHPAQRFEMLWRSLEQILRQSPNGATFTDLWIRWPEDAPKPSRATIYRVLDRACKELRATPEGRGTRFDPWRWRLVEGSAKEP